jgi:sterol desaturase/sphingolipid hydroxylase (fatty acid hydroxylase superfamily)
VVSKGGGNDMRPGALPKKSPEPLVSRTKHYKAAAQKKFLHTFAEGRLNYWFSFVSDSAAGLFFLTWAIALRPVSPPAIVALFLAGFFLWSFSEYVFHRWLYHPESGIFGSGHRMHHDEEQAYVAMPFFVSGIAVLGMWYVIAVWGKFPSFSALLAGWMAGFVLYSWVHHAHHHWTLKSVWMRKLRAYHRVHHRFPDRNFGVTMRFWDRVFGTRHRPGIG